MLPDADRMTRAQIAASVVVLGYVWIFLVAVVLQNVQRPADELPPPPSQTHGRLVSIYVTETNQVITDDSGMMLSHVPLMQCENQVIAVEVSESGPFIMMAEVAMHGYKVGYNIWVERPYVVVSSRTGINLRFDNGQHVSLDVLCGRSAPAIHYMAVFVREDIVYLSDMTLGTATPLFILEPTCQLVWSDGAHTRKAYAWEMSVPLTGAGEPFNSDATVAFTFDTMGSARLHAAAANTYHVVSGSGVVQLYTDCGEPVLLPRPGS